MKKNDLSSSKLVSIRVPVNVLSAVERYCENNPFNLSRSAVLVYLIKRGLREQGFEVKE